MTTDQIWAEAAEDLRRLANDDFDMHDIRNVIKTAIEKAKLVWDEDLDEEVNRVMPDRAAYASEASPEALARRFHDIYERLAPNFGYETRKETRQFDPTSPNGRLMIAVCDEIMFLPPHRAAQASEKMKLIVCTSARENMRKCLEYCLLSVDYYRRNVIPELCSLGEVIPENFGRQPGWFKIPQIKKLLPDFDYVLCVDADTMFVGKQDIRELIQPFTLNIAQDKNGINCGVMTWKNCPESFAALDHIEASYERYCNDAWQEQRVLTNMISEKRIDVCYQTKHIWNAYPYPYEQMGFTDEAPDSLIIHYANVLIPERERLMEERWTKLR